jgi:hypothetical protein
MMPGSVKHFHFPEKHALDPIALDPVGGMPGLDPGLKSAIALCGLSNRG